MAVCEKCLFDQNWAKIPRTYTSGHLQGMNLIWDQLLATKGEIIQSQAIFSCLCKTEGDFVI